MIYKVFDKTGNKLLCETDRVNLIKLAKNGCYNLCEVSEAEGAAVHFTVKEKDAESGAMVDVTKTSVFALKEGGLSGKESVAIFVPALF